MSRNLLKVKAPFIDEISGLAIVKMLDRRYSQHSIVKIKIHAK